MYPGRYAVDHPDQAAIVMATSGEMLTYGDFERRCNQAAHLLRAAGMRRGDHIAVFMENQLQMLEIQGAAERTGLYFTLVNTFLKADEVSYIVANSRARVLFSSLGQREVATAAAQRCSSVERMFMTGLACPSGRWEPYEAAVNEMPGSPVADESLGAPMLYSSGTTGQPKGVLLPLQEGPPDRALPVIDFVSGMFGFRPGMTYLHPAPLYHSAAYGSVAPAIRLGATVVVMEHFDAEQWLALVQRYQVTHCQMVPTMFSRLLRLPEHVRARYDLSSLERLIHAAAPCPVPIKRAMIDWLGPIVTEYYGATEAYGYTSCDSKQWLSHPGTVGRPVRGDLLILDYNGDPCQVGVDGLIWFRGMTEFEYFDDPVKTAQSRSPDGMASTVGDIGHVDADGFLYLTDRQSHVIISGGVNIYPQEVENLLITHPYVLDAAVVGVPSDDLGEEVKAVVQLADPDAAGPEQAAELIAFCRASLAHFKCPRSVDFVTELPRLPTGKLYKRILRDVYWTGHQMPVR